MKIIDFFKRNKLSFLFYTRKKQYIQHIEELKNELKMKKGQLIYVCEYLQNNPCKFVKQGDVLAYCDYRRNQDTNGEKPNYRDNSRAIEILRKNRIPLRWIEVVHKGELYFMYCKNLEVTYIESEIQRHNKKREYFPKSLIKSTLEKAKYKCEMCHISANNIKLECDHWVPKEKYGNSDKTNAICLCCTCNPKKNKNLPEEWFCKHFIINFYKISKRFNLWQQHKTTIIKFINSLE
jgi:hypothetical protein